MSSPFYAKLNNFRTQRPCERGGLYGFVNNSGEFVIPLKYKKVLPFSEGLAAVFDGKKWGYIDIVGNLAIDFRFESVSIHLSDAYFKDGRAVVESNGKEVVVDREGNVIK